MRRGARSERSGQCGRGQADLRSPHLSPAPGDGSDALPPPRSQARATRGAWPPPQRPPPEEGGRERGGVFAACLLGRAGRGRACVAPATARTFLPGARGRGSPGKGRRLRKGGSASGRRWPPLRGRREALQARADSPPPTARHGPSCEGAPRRRCPSSAPLRLPQAEASEGASASAPVRSAGLL